MSGVCVLLPKEIEVGKIRKIKKKKEGEKLSLEQHITSNNWCIK